jgi:hypothetical protein
MHLSKNAGTYKFVARISLPAVPDTFTKKYSTSPVVGISIAQI